MSAKETLLKFREKADALYGNSIQRTYFKMFGHPIDQRFAIIGNARTGSNFLLDGLKSSPSIRVYHEIFADHNRRLGEDFDRVFSTVFQPKVNLQESLGLRS